MSAFKDMVARDIHNVFLDTNFFGEKRTVEYDGERYEDIPVVMMEAEEKDRSVSSYINQLLKAHLRQLDRKKAEERKDSP